MSSSPFKLLLLSLLTCLLSWSTLTSCDDEPPKASASCMIDAECLAGVCRSGACVYVVRECSGVGCCQSAEDCREGFGCEALTGDCFALECLNSQECALGLVCDGGRCLIDPSADRDRDGVPDATDSCPDIPNAQGDGAADDDGDGLGNVCDPDLDGDGVINELDSCVGVYNPTQDPLVCEGDVDGDGLPNSIDNCPELGNESQGDLNHDNIGDGCDPDIDGDGVPNQLDTCPLVSDPAQLDSDGDGVGDLCEPDLQWSCGACGVASATLNDEGALELTCRASRCFERRVEVCDERVWRVAQDCTLEGQRCVSGEGEPRCLSPEEQPCSSARDCLTGRCEAGRCARPEVDEPACRPEATLTCSGGDVYWLDSCGVKGEVAERCEGGSLCVIDEPPRCACAPEVSERCEQGARVSVDSCGVSGELIERCEGGRVCEEGAGETAGETACVCRPNDHYICLQGDLYWESSCGDLEGLAEACVEGAQCERLSEEERALNPLEPSHACRCASRASQGCEVGASGERVVWLNSCGEVEEEVLSCSEGARCVASEGVGSCVCEPQHSLTCHQGHVYWQDSCGERGALVEACVEGRRCVEGGERGASCQCDPQHEQLCSGGDVYWFNSCGERAALVSDCLGATRCVLGAEGASCAPIVGSTPCESAEVAGGCPALEFVTLPGGDIVLGNSADPKASPTRALSVPPFELMRAEVTVAQYRVCVEAGGCTAPSCEAGELLNGYPVCNYALNRAAHPVNFVSWRQAREFAAWVGARLPSEVEWEFAARDRGAYPSFPWGSEALSCERADTSVSFSPCNGTGTSEVCAHPLGSSSLGLCDLIGNASELLDDDWHETYQGAPNSAAPWCRSSTCSDLNAPLKVVRGGAHSSANSAFDPPLSATRRFYVNSTSANSAMGFRLARSLSP